MLKPGGYLITCDPDPTKSRGQQAVVENDTTTCRHCGCLIKVPPLCKPQDMPYSLCWGCRGNICLKCDGEMARTMTCDNIEKKLERAEARDRLRRDIG
jgi:hypothetical protein